MLTEIKAIMIPCRPTMLSVSKYIRQAKQKQTARGGDREVESVLSSSVAPTLSNVGFTETK